MITEEQIWSYLDGQLNVAEKKDVERVIANDSKANVLFEEISALHKSLKQESLLLSPSVSFTDRVMAAINMNEAYVAPPKLSFKPFLIFALPSLLVVAAFIALLVYKQVPLTYSLPVAMPQFKHFQIYFFVGDILLLAYFVDRFSEYRLNRKTLFA